MKSPITRRRFITTAAAAVPTVAVPGVAALSRFGASGQVAQAAEPAPATRQETANSFSFPLLGDLHYDRLGDHDMEWLAREHPGDVHQVQDYSRITAEVQPGLFGEVRAVVNDLRAKPSVQVPFVLHVGDLVEGLCGNSALAMQQDEAAVGFTRAANLQAPFLFCKGNHDVTGPAARETFDGVLLPFLSEQLRLNPQLDTEPGRLAKAYYALQYGNCLFAFFDAYDDTASLDWLEQTLAGAKARHIFVLIHPPVVPYGARSTWHVFARPNQAAQRTRLLNLLGQHNAIVLGGHIHKYNVLTRHTEAGRFVQLAVSSVIARPDVEPTRVLEGVKEYTPDQIKVEPDFSPATEAERRAMLAAEAPFIEYFEYADLPGYAVISVQGAAVLADIYKGIGRRPWKRLDLTGLLAG